MRRILVQPLLARRHAILPLEILRYRHVLRPPHQQDDPLVVEILLGLIVAGIVAQVVAVREEDFRHRRIDTGIIIEAQDRALRQAVGQLIVTRQHHPQPGPAALAERHEHTVGELEPAVFLLAAAQALEFPAFLLRQEQRGHRDQRAVYALDDLMHGGGSGPEAIGLLHDGGDFARVSAIAGNGKAEAATKRRNLSWRAGPLGRLARQHCGVAGDRGAVVEHRGACLQPCPIGRARQGGGDRGCQRGVVGQPARGHRRRRRRGSPTARSGSRC